MVLTTTKLLYEGSAPRISQWFGSSVPKRAYRRTKCKWDMVCLANRRRRITLTNDVIGHSQWLGYGHLHRTNSYQRKVSPSRCLQWRYNDTSSTSTSYMYIRYTRWCTRQCSGGNTRLRKPLQSHQSKRSLTSLGHL